MCFIVLVEFLLPLFSLRIKLCFTIRTKRIDSNRTNVSTVVEIISNQHIYQMHLFGVQQLVHIFCRKQCVTDPKYIRTKQAGFFPIGWFVHTNVKLKMDPISLGTAVLFEQIRRIIIIQFSCYWQVERWLLVVCADQLQLLIIIIINSLCCFFWEKICSHKQALVFQKCSNFITNRWSIHRSKVMKYSIIKNNASKLNWNPFECSQVCRMQV